MVDLDVAPVPSVRRRHPMPSRSVALLVVGLLTLVAVAGSARAAPSFAGALWSGPYDRDNDTLTLTPTTLFLSHHDAGGPALKAYDLATGVVRWSAPSADVMARVPSVAGGVIVAPDGFERYFERPDLLLARTTRTIARDARTGAALWRATGEAEAVTDRSVLLVDSTGSVPSLREVGLRDGGTLWSRTAPGLAQVAVVGDVVVTAGTDGRLTVLRDADGSVERTEKVPWPGLARLSSVAGLLVVTGQAPSGQTSTVYRPDTLAELWRAGGALTDCRAVLCGTEPGALIGYDPSTGARRWRLAGMTAASPLRNDRIVASSEGSGLFQLLDPATGRPLGGVGSGLGSGRPDSRTAAGSGPAFLLRGVTTAPDETAVVRLDLRTGEQSLQGTLEGTGWLGCRSAAKYLVCLQNSRLTVTAAD